MILHHDNISWYCITILQHNTKRYIITGITSRAGNKNYKVIRNFLILTEKLGITF